MSPADPLLVVLVAVLAVVALASAFALGVRTAVTQQRRGGADPASLLRAALEAVDRPVLVVTTGARVVEASAAAVGLGLERAGFLAHEELRHVVAERLRPEAPATSRPQDLTVLRGPLGTAVLDLRVVSHRLDADHVLLDLEDRGEARRVEDVRRDFVVNVSHELKTPVGAIGVLAETLSTAADDAEAVRRFAGRLEGEARRLQTLVADIIELSRVQVVDSGRERGPVALDEVVAEALDAVRVRAEEHRIDVVVQHSPDVRVVGDRDLLVTAVRNLLSNAVAYSPDGTRVSVSVGRRDGLATVQVTDRGIGIPRQDQERVFERFYRVDPARSRSTGGTGLGLAIVKHVAEDHGGDVTLWSRPGQGSTFTLRLPDPDDVAGTAPEGDEVGVPGDRAAAPARHDAPGSTPSGGEHA